VQTLLGISSGIADNTVTNAKLTDMAANTIKGAVSAGDPQDLTAAQVNSIVAQGGGFSRKTAAYTLGVADVGLVIEMDVTTTAHNLTVPTNTTAAIPINAEIHGVQRGTGQTTIFPADGTVIINASGGKLKAAARYSAWTLKKVGTNEWYAWGDLTT
jgi:hypothetical protein